MKLRVALVAGAVLAGTVAGTAFAAPKKVCNLVTDPKGDSSYSAGIPGTPSTDIVGGDIASDKTRITAVIRVAKLSTSDPQAPFGQAWFFTFVPKGLPPDAAESLFLAGYATPTGGQEFVFGHRGDHAVLPIGASYSLGKATGVFDTAKNEIRVTAEISKFGEFAALLGKGKTYGTFIIEAAKLAGQRAAPSPVVSGFLVPIGGLTMPHDLTEATTKTYISGAMSCVAIGK